MKAARVGELIDYSQQLVRIERVESQTWKALAKAHIECAEMALDISEMCAVAARVAADKVGDAISAEYGLVELSDQEDEEDDLDD